MLSDRSRLNRGCWMARGQAGVAKLGGGFEDVGGGLTAGKFTWVSGPHGSTFPYCGRSHPSPVEQTG